MQRFRQKIFIRNTIPPSFFRGYQEYRGKGKEKKKKKQPTNNPPKTNTKEKKNVSI